MSLNRWNERFAKTTRGRILALLRPGPHTVDELATSLGRTDNAVRAHLTALERDGLVRASGTRPSGTGKPPQAYALAPEAERLFFSSACAPFLTHFLRSASARLAPAQLRALMRSVGEGLAADHPRPAGPPRARVDAVARLLGELGGMTKVEGVKGRLVIRGLSCPVGGLAERHPEVCGAIETFAGALAGLPTRERCQRGPGVPRCLLEFTLPPPARSAARAPRRTRRAL